jgi:hypothetical protein
MKNNFFNHKQYLENLSSEKNPNKIVCFKPVFLKSAIFKTLSERNEKTIFAMSSISKVTCKIQGRPEGGGRGSRELLAPFPLDG